MSFTKIAQANMDHYNAHPVRHTVILGALCAVALVGSNKLTKMITKEDPALASGKYA